MRNLVTVYLVEQKFDGKWQWVSRWVDHEAARKAAGRLEGARVRRWKVVHGA